MDTILTAIVWCLFKVVEVVGPWAEPWLILIGMFVGIPVIVIAFISTLGSLFPRR